MLDTLTNVAKFLYKTNHKKILQKIKDVCLLILFLLIKGIQGVPVENMINVIDSLENKKTEESEI